MSFKFRPRRAHLTPFGSGLFKIAFLLCELVALKDVSMTGSMLYSTLVKKPVLASADMESVECLQNHLQLRLFFREGIFQHFKLLPPSAFTLLRAPDYVQLLEAISGIENLKAATGAKQIISLMVNNGVLLSSDHFMYAFKACSQKQHVIHASSILKTMRTHGVAMNTRTVDILLDLFSSTGNVALIMQVMHICRTDNIHVPIIKVLCALAKNPSTVYLADELARGWFPGTKAGHKVSHNHSVFESLMLAPSQLNFSEMLLEQTDVFKMMFFGHFVLKNYPEALEWLNIISKARKFSPQLIMDIILIIQTNIPGYECSELSKFHLDLLERFEHYAAIERYSMLEAFDIVSRSQLNYKAHRAMRYLTSLKLAIDFEAGGKIPDSLMKSLRFADFLPMMLYHGLGRMNPVDRRDFALKIISLPTIPSSMFDNYKFFMNMQYVLIVWDLQSCISHLWIHWDFERQSKLDSERILSHYLDTIMLKEKSVDFNSIASKTAWPAAVYELWVGTCLRRKEYKTAIQAMQYCIDDKKYSVSDFARSIATIYQKIESSSNLRAMLDSGRSNKSTLDIFNRLICLSKDNSLDTKGLFASMKSHKIQPDSQTYRNILTKTVGMAAMRQVYEDMLSNDIPPTSSIFTTMLTCKDPHTPIGTSWARWIEQEMIKHEVKPDTKFRVHLLEFYFRRKGSKVCLFAAWRDIQAGTFKPTPFGWTIIFDWFYSQNNLPLLWDVWNTRGAKSWAPARSLGLLRRLAKAGQFSKASLVSGYLLESKAYNLEYLQKVVASVNTSSQWRQPSDRNIISSGSKLMQGNG